jgi:hypothetical protein
VNEHDWLNGTDPHAMLDRLYASEKADRRKIGFYFGECCGLIQRSVVVQGIRRTPNFNADDHDYDQDALTEAQFHLGSAIYEAIRTIGNNNGEHAYLATILREVFGNPFRPIIIDPRWLSSTVVDISRAIYDERAFDKMPILADALMDAGCDSEEILNHCRCAGPHVRGCWVVDLLLGKE